MERGDVVGEHDYEAGPSLEAIELAKARGNDPNSKYTPLREFKKRVEALDRKRVEGLE